MGSKPDFKIKMKVNEYWREVGAAWYADNGALNGSFDLLPVGASSQIKFKLFPETTEGSNTSNQSSASPTNRELDDEIPF